MFCVCALRSVRTKIRLHQCLATRYRQCSTAKESCEDTEHPTITEDDEVTQTKELKIRRNKAQKILTNLYTENERQLLLDRFNNADEAELCNIKYLRVRTAKKIIEHREKHGLFKDIHSLVGICGIGEKMMQFYCVDIMDKIAGNQSATQKKSNIKTSNKMNFFAMKPNLSEERLQSLQSIVSIDIAFKSIAWIHMERDMKVCDWKHQQLDVKPSRHDPIAYVENVSSLIEEMPVADLYLLEYITFRQKSLSLVSAMLHIRTLESMLYGMLNGRYPDTHEHKVVSVGRMTVGKHFDLFVGLNRKSGQPVAMKYVEMAAMHRNPLIVIPPSLIQMYLAGSQIDKEHLSNCLLQAIAFYELAVYNKVEN